MGEPRIETDKRRLTPKLRFPEFRSSGNWKSDRIAEVATISKGRGISKADVAEGGTTPCIRYAELYTHYGEVIHEVRSYTNIPPDELILSEAEDVILPASGETRADIATAACVMREGVALGSDLNILRSDLHGPFFSYLLNSPLRYKIARVAQGDTVAHLYPSQISKILIAVPTPPEQQKIAECLSSLDGLIAAEGRMLEALKAHKKGLMQQLFPQPGQTQPRLRFPEFRDKGEWDQKTLKQIAHYENGKAYEKHIVETGRYIVVNSRFISTDGQVRKYSDEVFCIAKKGDVLMVLSDLPNGRALAKCFLVPEDDAYAVNQRVCRLDPFQIASAFLFYALNRHPNLMVFDDRMTQTHLSKPNVCDCILAIPVEEKEQKAIANCLTALDTRIAAQAAKIDVLKQHKRGLMQQLFPIEK